jgi:hypothetical protein
MGGALKSRRLLIAAAVVAAILAGLGASAKAGLLSRAESTGTDSRAAGAAVGTSETGDVIAVAESDAHWPQDEETPPSAGARLLRVGDTSIGEAPEGFSDPLAGPFDGQPTEAVVDMGCDGGTAQAPACLSLLRSDVSNDSTVVHGRYSVALVRVNNTGVILLTSGADQGPCFGDSGAAVAQIFPDITASGTPMEIDPSLTSGECPEPVIGGQ